MDLDIFEMLREAHGLGASDIHISTGEKPSYRIDGDMVYQEKYPVLTLDISVDLIEQSMTEEQKEELKREKDLNYAIDIPMTARFRANTFFTTKGANAVFHIIPSTIISFTDLGLPESLRKITQLTKGLVLVTGSTGCGKSTTIAAIIDLINNTKRSHIITIEDPIEFVHVPKKSIITHRQVGKHTKTFASALKAVTRQDPDIVLVGEMRDLETISLALTAAETGTLVFGTLHTSSAAKTIDRIIDVFPAEEQSQIRSMLADSIQFIIAQELVKKIGGGRVVAHEILIATDGIRNQIRKGDIHQIPTAIQSGADMGMQSLDQSLGKLIRNKIITFETARIYARNIDELRKFAGIQK